MILDRLGKLIAVDAVGIHGNSQNLRIENMEGLERDQIGGILDNDFIVGVDHHCTDHGKGLLGAVGDDNVVRAHIADAHGLIALGNPLTQCRPALGGAVLQRGDAVLFQNLLCGSFHFRNGEGNGVRKTAGKGDNVRRSCCGQNGGRKLTLEVRFHNSVRKFQLHNPISLYYKVSSVHRCSSEKKK